VLVKLRTAAALSPQNVAAICQLAASAVEGLSADMVSVLDTNGNLLNRARTNAAGDAADGSEAALDYRKTIEHDLQNKIGATLEPLLGAEHFRTSVSAEVDLTSGEQSEEVFDPQKSVMVTSQRTDDGPALTTASGVPGTTSNVPVPPAKPTTTSGNFARHTENITYQSSRVVKLTKLPRGTVKKLSLSVLVDHTVHFEGTGAKSKRIIDAPSAEKLKVIHDLVAAATGLNTERGDQLVVEAFPFEATLLTEPEVSLETPPAVQVPRFQMPPWLDNFIKKKPKIAAGAAGGTLVLLLAGGWFFLRWWKKKNKRIQAEMAASALEAARLKTLPQTPEEMQKLVEGQLAQNASDKARQELETLMQLKLPVVTTKKTEVLAKHITAETKSNPAAMAQVVRTWLNG
jgi:flagellar M-ring protein FliF